MKLDVLPLPARWRLDERMFATGVEVGVGTGVGRTQMLSRGRKYPQ